MSAWIKMRPKPIPLRSGQLQADSRQGSQARPPSRQAATDVRVTDYDAVFIPGGAWNPDMLRTDGKALQIVRDARTHGLLIVSLCHGPQVLISAAPAPDGRVVFPPGTWITGVDSIRVDLKNAGFAVVDEATVYDEGSRILTARGPDDLGSLCVKMGNLLRQRLEQRSRG